MPVRSCVGVSKNMTPPWPPTYHWKLPLPGSCAAAESAPKDSASAATGMLRESMRITDCLRKVSAPGGPWRLPRPQSAVRQNAGDVLESAGGEGERWRRYLLERKRLADRSTETLQPVGGVVGARDGPVEGGNGGTAEGCVGSNRYLIP